MTFPVIISPSLLDQLLQTHPGLVLIDARSGSALYEAGHLRTAVHADLEKHLSTASEPETDAARGGRHPLPPLDRWARLLGEWGIGPQTPVVVYDAADGSNAASRVWWMLRSVGHESAGVLDGGLQAATEHGFDITTDSAATRSISPYPITGWQLPLVDLDEVNWLRNDPDWKVLDVRSAPRFRGEVEPIDPIAGHIPGAVNLPFSENLCDGRFKPVSELRRQYEEILDGTAPDHLVVHCGSGVTACHTLLALEAAGLPGAALYVGSWSEWCRNELPRAGGE